MAFDAIIMAGGEVPDDLREYTESRFKGLLRLGGRYMVEYVVDAVGGVAGVGRRVCIGPPDELGEALRGKVEKVLPPESSMMLNLKKGVGELSGAEWILVATCDVPLVTAAIIEDFLAACRRREADMYYPVVEKRVVEGKYPGVERTYGRLRDGVFTGGNLFLVNPKVFTAHWHLIERAMALRKSPFRLLGMLGFFFIVKFVFRRLSLADIERKVEKIMGMRGVPVIVEHPEIGVDVDKESDYLLVRRILEA
ncbi:MAG: nucleotidyltransferase family protein [bacterium]